MKGDRLILLPVGPAGHPTQPIQPGPHLARGPRRKERPTLGPQQQRVPRTGGQRVHVEVGTTAGRAYHHPPIGRSPALAHILKEVFTEDVWNAVSVGGQQAKWRLVVRVPRARRCGSRLPAWRRRWGGGLQHPLPSAWWLVLVCVFAQSVE